MHVILLYKLAISWKHKKNVIKYTIIELYQEILQDKESYYESIL